MGFPATINVVTHDNTRYDEMVKVQVDAGDAPRDCRPQSQNTRSRFLHRLVLQSYLHVSAETPSYRSQVRDVAGGLCQDV
jgi:hypothetical protein